MPSRSRIYKSITISKIEQGHACQDDQVFLIVPLTRFPRLARLGARDCSSGSPDPERRIERKTFLARSAGACPPRASDLRENRTPTNAVSSTEARRGTGPRPTVKGGGLANRSAGNRPPRASACPSDCSSGSPDPERAGSGEPALQRMSAPAKKTSLQVR